MRVNADENLVIPQEVNHIVSDMIEHIYEVIEAKGGIPYGEVNRVLYARIAHWNRQAWPLFWTNSKYLRLRLWKTSGNVANDERKSAKNP